MNEIIIINKEKGLTSHDVVKRIRKILNTKRIGHTGTLDPIASGVLIVCVDQATKLVQFLENQSKKYQCEILLGTSTDTLDITGNILKKEVIDRSIINKIDDLLSSMIGIVDQYPPIYSAIKVNGKKLYEYARKNIEVDIEPRRIEIKNLKRISDFEFLDDGQIKFWFEAEVSKGTYIRSICRDIGEKLNIPSTMNDLIRTEVGGFTINSSYHLEDIERGNYQSYSMLEILHDLHKTDNEIFISKAFNGMKISFSNIYEIFKDYPSRFIIYQNDNLIAIYDKDEEKHCYKAVRVWK